MPHLEENSELRWWHLVHSWLTVTPGDLGLLVPQTWHDGAPASLSEGGYVCVSEKVLGNTGAHARARVLLRLAGSSSGAPAMQSFRVVAGSLVLTGVEARHAEPHPSLV